MTENDKCFWCGYPNKIRTNTTTIYKNHDSCFQQLSDWCWENVEESLQIMNKSKIRRLDNK